MVFWVVAIGDYLLVKMIRVQEWRGAGFVQITCTKFALENNIQFSWSSKICKCVNIWETRVSLSVAGGLGPVVRKWERETARESKSTSVCISFETHLFQREPCFWVLAFLGTVSDWCCLCFSLCHPLPTSCHDTHCCPAAAAGREKTT